MDLHRLRTFQALSETLHFRHAAERLGITQSAVSQQIALLEKDPRESLDNLSSVKRAFVAGREMAP